MDIELKKSSSMDFHGDVLTLETGELACFADASVMVKYGKNVLLCVLVVGKEEVKDQGFLPLTVNYQEKWYAAGKIPSSFTRREGRPTERDILMSRLIDRSLRPMIPVSALKRELQINCTVMSYDSESEIDALAILGCSAILEMFGVPGFNPIAAVHISYENEKLVFCPSHAMLQNSKLDLVVSGTKENIVMLEGSSKEVSESFLLETIKEIQPEITGLINFVSEFCAKVGSTRSFEVTQNNEDQDGLLSEHLEMKDQIISELKNVYHTPKKELVTLKANLVEMIVEKLDCEKKEASSYVSSLEKLVNREILFETGKRKDSRESKDIRNITPKIGYLNVAHGSSLFTRGNTQALAVVALGTAYDEMIMDNFRYENTMKENFILHYNFHAFSVGEIGYMRGVSRREVGHGKLAWKAIKGVLPDKNLLPYTVRVVSEITSSDGSSSMATVCATSMALMDAGVDISSTVSGIAMGLIQEGDSYVILSDISGAEDGFGDMDCKIAGTRQGITAIQMDIKLTGVSVDIIGEVLAQSYEGRMSIIDSMEKSISSPSKELKENTPVTHKFEIDKNKKRDLIGPGGKNIKKICELSKTKINLDDNGNVTISAPNKNSLTQAIDMINELVVGLEDGKIYKGTITSVASYGIFVMISQNSTGMVHVNEIDKQYLDDLQALKGQTISVLVMSQEKNRIRLSMKRVNQETGELIPEEEKPTNSDTPVEPKQVSKGAQSTESAANNSDVATPSAVDGGVVRSSAFSIFAGNHTKPRYNQNKASRAPSYKYDSGVSSDVLTYSKSQSKSSNSKNVTESSSTNKITDILKNRERASDSSESSSTPNANNYAAGGDKNKSDSFNRKKSHFYKKNKV